MLLRDWRTRRDLTLTEAIKLFGLKSASSLSAIERGTAYPTWETVTVIHIATGGLVSARDHLAASRGAYPKKSRDAEAAGRKAAAQLAKILAKRKEHPHGRKAEKQA